MNYMNLPELEDLHKYLNINDIKNNIFLNKIKMLNRPIIIDSFLAGVQLNYDWNTDVKNNFIAPDPKPFNKRVHNAIIQMNSKASVGLANCLAECVIWKLELYVNEPVLHYLEAAWLSVIDKAYIKKWEPDVSFINGTVVEAGPLFTALSVLQRTLKAYKQQSFYIHQRIINQAMLARYVLSEKEKFDEWLLERLITAGNIFPCTYTYKEIEEMHEDAEDEDPAYDSSGEAPVSRSFFFNADVIYTPENDRKQIDTFIQSVDYKNNPYLFSPEEMKANGFKGEPYLL